MPMFDPVVPVKPVGRLAWTEIERDSRPTLTLVTWQCRWCSRKAVTIDPQHPTTCCCQEAK